MKKLTVLVLFLIGVLVTAAQKNPQVLIAPCSGSTSHTFLDISNVRAEILHNGDMWWGLGTSSAKYEVPKGSGKTSFFAGALWIGGLDVGDNLHLAGQNYRQSGNDFWPGPLDTTNATVDTSVCLQYDRFWNIYRQDVLNFIGGSAATADMISYPGNGTGNQSHFLAPFYDNNGDGIYNTTDGDYPLFDNLPTSGSDCCNSLHGDQSIWYIYNDVGNAHGEIGGAQIGIEIQEQAFAFLSNDSDINNTTFYQYKIINRNSAAVYHNTYIGSWIDPDLGNYADDFVGCDVKRGMGYVYNSVDTDGTAQGYGINPPAAGVDFVIGPLADAGDGIDNNRDSVIDEVGERIIMSSFRYYVNGGNPVTDDGTSSIAYYNQLNGKWNYGSPYFYGGDGYCCGFGHTTDTCKFIFPGTSDPYGWGTKGIIEAPWSEETAGFPGGDRRMLVPAGAFTFFPGQVQCVTMATVWARGNSGRLSSVAKLQTADDKAQYLADHCWDITSLINVPLLEKPIDFSIYPNPAHSDFTVTLNSAPTNSNILLSIYSAIGEKVYTRTVSGKQETVNTRSLAPGLYFVRISDGERSVVQKLVVQ